MKKTTILLFLIIIPLIFIAQNENKTLSLSIKQAQDYAIENNKSLKNYNIDVEIAKRQMWQIIAKGLPQVSGTIDYTNYFNYKMNLSLGGGSGSTFDINNISQEMMELYGFDKGDISILGLLESMMGGGGTEIKMKNSSNAKLQATQLLFSGEYITGIQMQKIARMFVDINNEKSILDIKEQVTNTYYQSLIIQKSIDLLDANLENLKETLKKTEVLYNIGMIEETSVDQLKLTISSIEIQKNSLQRNAQLNLSFMKIHLSLKPDDEITLTEKYDDVFGSMDFSSTLNSTFDIKNTINMRLLEKQENIQERKIALKRWAFAPTLVGIYSHTEKLMTTSFDMNPKNLFMLQLSIPIWSSGERTTAVQEQKLELLKLQNNREIISEQLALQEQQLRLNLISALEQYNNQKENIALAQKIYEKTEIKFRQGVVSSFDLIQAHSNLLQAQSSFIQTGMQVLQTKLILDKFLEQI